MTRSRLIRVLGPALLAIAACAASNKGAAPPRQDDAGNQPPNMTGNGSNGSGSDATSSPPPAPPATGAMDAGTSVDLSGGASDAPAIADARPGSAGTAPSGPCTAELCEGFETVPAGGKPDPTLWMGGNAVVDTLHPALGTKQSLHFPPTTAGGSFITYTKPVPGGGKVFYGRLFIWFDRQPIEKPNPLYHWTMIQPEGGGMQLRIGGHIEGQGGDWIRLNPGNGTGETGLSDLTAVLESKQWYCLEFFFDTPNNESRIWLNGRERTVLHWKNSVAGWQYPPGGVDVIRFGFTEYQGAKTPFELWIDEIALGTKRIGCGDFPTLPDASDTSTLKDPPAGQGNGVTSCGGCASGQKCCTAQMGPFHPRCAPSADVCLATSCQLSCDGPEDCPGQQCCIESVSETSGCQASCDGGTFTRLCHAQADCPAGQMCCPTNFTAGAGLKYSYCSVGPC